MTKYKDNTQELSVAPEAELCCRQNFLFYLTASVCPESQTGPDAKIVPALLFLPAEIMFFVFFSIMYIYFNPCENDTCHLQTETQLLKAKIKHSVNILSDFGTKLLYVLEI